MEPKPYYETPPEAPSRVRLYLGDCRELMSIVAPPSERVIVLADPLYGIGARSSGRHTKQHVIHDKQGRITGNRRKADRDYPEIGDQEASDVAFLLAYERCLIWGWNHIADQLPPTPSLIFWDKRELVAPDDGADGEVAWTNLGGPTRCFRHLWRGLCQASEKGSPRFHPTQKPEAFYRWLYAGRGRGKPVVSAGDLIAVPYAGSGPEIAPAMELGIDVVAFDVVSEYLDTIIKHRIEPALKRGRQVNLFAAPVAREEQVPLF